MTELARVTTLEELALVLRARRQSLGLSQLLVDELGGLQSGYTGKIEAEALNPGRGKGLGKVTIPLLLGALKVELLVVPATSRHSKSRAKSEACEGHENYFTRRARKARAAQLAQMTPKERRDRARAAAKARWAKVRADKLLAREVGNSRK